MNSVGRMISHFGFCVLDPAGMGGSYKRRERFNNAVFISPERDFLYTKCEKCANVTLRRSLQNLVADKALPESMSDIDRWHAPLLQPSDLKLTRIKSINDIPFKFAVVRNPYSRLLSFYLGAEPKNFRKVLGTSQPMTFGEFVDLACSQPVEKQNPHWRVQYHNIFCDLIRYDHFARFEKLEEELVAIMSRHGKKQAEIRSVHKNASNAGSKLASYYTSELVAKVRDKYAIDFESFGYPTELPV